MHSTLLHDLCNVGKIALVPYYLLIAITDVHKSIYQYTHICIYIYIYILYVFTNVVVILIVLVYVQMLFIHCTGVRL